jgi:4a-hydroxytetrahydrobiopterin dehydratase
MSHSMQNLATQHCKPLRGSEHCLSAELTASGLLALSGWQVLNGELVREFKFIDYYHSIAFVNALAYVAHAQDHHPELSVHYNRVQVRFSTHDVGGLSLNDFICAAKVDALISI